MKVKSGRQADAAQDFKRGDSEYALAARLKPQGAPNIFKNWGILLKQMAMPLSYDPEAQQRLLTRAVNTLKQGHTMDPNDFMILENIGLVRLILSGKIVLGAI
jgi:hypothetical protein